jgi:hypothetical protein
MQSLVVLIGYIKQPQFQYLPTPTCRQLLWVSIQLNVASFIHSPPSYHSSISGVDVIHPAPGTKSVPSFGALVSSLAPNAANYVAMDSIQLGRKELVADLQPMIQA